MTRLVVVGNGMVGSRFVEDLLAADLAGRFRVTVLGDEPCEPYNRVLLSEVVAGRYDLASLTLPTSADPRLEVRRGTAAVSIDREDRAVIDAGGCRHRYDQLVLATGAAARIPAIPGLRADDGGTARGVHALRSIDDAREIIAATLNARRAVVLGAGVLGLEAAAGLARRGVPVTVVHPMSALMERQLDEAASRVVEQAMEQAGIDHRVGVGAEEVLVEAGRLRGLRLGNGEVVETDLLVVSTGTVANAAIAAEAGLRTQRGILVTPAMATLDDPRIFAIGDCAQPPDGSSGLVAQGWEQAKTLVGHLTSATTGIEMRQPARSTARAASPHGRANHVVRLKADGLDVVTMGICGSERDPEPAHRVVRLSDPAAGRHVEVVVSGGQLVGATCVGAGALAADLVAAYTRCTPTPADPAYLLLRPTAGSAAPVVSPADLPDAATVCRCNGVSKGEILDCASQGGSSLGEVARRTRATTGCGSCRDDVCALLTLAPAPETEVSPQATGRSEDRFTNGKHLLHSAETRAS
jgi:assimilatory nitrate reductase electron transfer subunit